MIMIQTFLSPQKVPLCPSAVSPPSPWPLAATNLLSDEALASYPGSSPCPTCVTLAKPLTPSPLAPHVWITRLWLELTPIHTTAPSSDLLSHRARLLVTCNVERLPQLNTTSENWTRGPLGSYRSKSLFFCIVSELVQVTFTFNSSVQRRKELSRNLNPQHPQS